LKKGYGRFCGSAQRRERFGSVPMDISSTLTHKRLESLEHHLRTALQILEGLKEEIKKSPSPYTRRRRGKYTELGDR